MDFHMMSEFLSASGWSSLNLEVLDMLGDLFLEGGD